MGCMDAAGLLLERPPLYSPARSWSFFSGMASIACRCCWQASQPTPSIRCSELVVNQFFCIDDNLGLYVWCSFVKISVYGKLQYTEQKIGGVVPTELLSNEVRNMLPKNSEKSKIKGVKKEEDGIASIVQAEDPTEETQVRVYLFSWHCTISK